MTAPAGASRAEALEDAIRQCAQVAEGVREGYSFADSLETVLGAIDVLMERVRTAPREAAPDMGGCTLDLSDPIDARFLREVLTIAAERYDEEDLGVSAAKARELRRRINAGILRVCERRCGIETGRAVEAHRAAEAVTDSDETEASEA